MGDYSLMQTIGRGLYAAGDGDLAAYDKIRQDAVLAQQKAVLDQQERATKAAQWQFEQEQQLQNNGYLKLGVPLDAVSKNSGVSTMSIPGGSNYFKLNNPEPKTYSEKLQKIKYEALSSLPLEARNNAVLGQKPVDDMSAYRLANTLAVAENGGSLMSGIGDNKDAYLKSREAWYQKLKKGVVAAGGGAIPPINQTSSDIESY